MNPVEVDAAASEIEPVVKALVMAGGDVLNMRPPDQKAIAKQLAEGGLRLVSDLATHRWVGADGLGLGAMWAPVDEPDLVEAPVPDVSGLSLAQKSALLEQLRADGLGGPDSPPPLSGDAEVLGGES